MRTIHAPTATRIPQKQMSHADQMSQYEISCDSESPCTNSAIMTQFVAFGHNYRMRIGRFGVTEALVFTEPHVHHAVTHGLTMQKV